MKKSFALTALACVSLVLTACGGSGGSLARTNPDRLGASAVINNTVTNTTTGNTTNSNSGSNSNNTPTDPVVVVGAGLANPSKALVNTAMNVGDTSKWGYVSYGDNVVKTKEEVLSPNNANMLTVEGKSFDLTRSNGDFNGVSQHVESSWSLHYGYLHDTNSGFQAALIQGHLTPPDNIPNDQTITYVGNAVYTCNDCAGKILTDSSTLVHVNFASKSLTGRLLGRSEKLNIAGTIDAGNSTFSGTHEGTRISGGFFGNHAEEIGGVFENANKGVSGAFGARGR